MAAEPPALFDCLLWNGFEGGEVHYDVNPMPFRCKLPGIQKLRGAALFLFDALCTFVLRTQKIPDGSLASASPGQRSSVQG